MRILLLSGTGWMDGGGHVHAFFTLVQRGHAKVKEICADSAAHEQPLQARGERVCVSLCVGTPPIYSQTEYVGLCSPQQLLYF